MKDANNIQKVTNLINSEGMILGLYNDGNKTYFLKSLISPGKGYITYSVTKELLKDFYDNRYTIEDLLRHSESTLIDYDLGRNNQTFVKEDFYGKLHSGTKKISEFPAGMITPMPILE